MGIWVQRELEKSIVWISRQWLWLVVFKFSVFSDFFKHEISER